MKRFHISILLLIFLITVSGCGKKKESAKSVKPPAAVQNSSEHKKIKEQDENILDADEFSKALSGKKLKLSAEKNNTPDSEKKDSLKGLFQVDPVGNDAFDNEKFSEEKAPFNSLAETLISPHQYSWQPKWHYENGGGVQIQDAALSRDCSVLGLLEKVRLSSGKTGTLLILINTYNWKISRIYFYKEQLFTKMLFIGRGRRILAAEKKDNAGTKEVILHIINLKTGKESPNEYTLKGELEGIALSLKSKKAYIKLKDNDKVITVSIPHLSKEAECRTGLQNAFIKTGFDNIVMIGKEKIKIFNSDMTHINNEYKNPLQIIPDSMAFTGGNSTEFAFGAYMNKAILFKNGKHRILTEHSGKVMTALPEYNILVFSDMYKNQLRFINLGDFSENKPVVPAKIQPKTLAGARFIAYLKKRHRFIVLDTHGNLCLYWKGGRKTKTWKKHIIFRAEK